MASVFFDGKVLTEEIVDDFLIQGHKYEKCTLCDSFYGANFGEPVCSTCHMFVFPPDINYPEEGPYVEQKADSCDSGNEEPYAESDFFMPDRLGRDQVALPVVPKSDRLAERINALSCTRDFHLEKFPEELLDTLPPEVLLVVFRYLDDISLWTARHVCSRWRSLLDAEMADIEWKQFISLRWPLFAPKYEVQCWKSLYSKLLDSAPCKQCLESMMLQSTLPIEENSWRHRRLRSELKTLRADPPEGIQAAPLDGHCCHWQASITGPQGSPYEGGLFFLYLQIPHSYPMRPPVVRFITKIFHPNISCHGDVGLDSIHHNWSLALTISKVLISIQSLLTDPFCYVCMAPEIGKLYQENHKGFDRIARLWTWKYAMHDFLMPMQIFPQRRKKPPLNQKLSVITKSGSQKAHNTNM